MEDAPRRWSRPLIVAGAGAILIAGGATWLWLDRTPIATSFIDDALRAKGVPASYKLAEVGFRSQRIEHIRIGDPAHPDLVADWAEIELSVGLSYAASDAQCGAWVAQRYPRAAALIPLVEEVAARAGAPPAVVVLASG